MPQQPAKLQQQLMKDQQGASTTQVAAADGGLLTKPRGKMRGSQALIATGCASLAHQDGLQLVLTWLTQMGRRSSAQSSSHWLVTFWAAALRERAQSKV